MESKSGHLLLLLLKFILFLFHFLAFKSQYIEEQCIHYISCKFLILVILNIWYLLIVKLYYNYVKNSNRVTLDKFVIYWKYIINDVLFCVGIIIFFLTTITFLLSFDFNKNIKFIEWISLRILVALYSYFIWN